MAEPGPLVLALAGPASGHLAPPPRASLWQSDDLLHPREGISMVLWPELETSDGWSILLSMRMNASLKLSAVRTARERAGLTREQLAVRAGMSSSTLYLVERAGLISAVTAAKLAPILGVSAEALRESGA